MSGTLLTQSNLLPGTLHSIVERKLPVVTFFHQFSHMKSTFLRCLLLSSGPTAPVKSFYLHRPCSLRGISKKRERVLAESSDAVPHLVFAAAQWDERHATKALVWQGPVHLLVLNSILGPQVAIVLDAEEGGVPLRQV